MKTLPTRILPMVLAAAVAAVAPPARAQAPEPAIVDAANGPIPVRIEMITDTLSKTAQADVSEEFRNQYAPVSRKYGLYDSDDPELVLRFEFGVIDKSTGVYVVVAEASYRGEVLHRDEARTCVNCMPADLVLDALRIVAIGVEQVRDRRSQTLMADAESTPAPAPAEVPTAEDAGASSSPRSRIVGPMGYVGLASTVLGLGTGIAGAFVLDRGVRPTEGDTAYLTVTDYRTPGQALLGAGFGMILVGNVLLMVDVVVVGPRRRSTARAKIDGFAVMTANRTTGFTVRGRF